jgi:perosamine synthetase
MIPYGRHHIDEDDIQAVVDVLRGGALAQGPTIELFEQTVAEYVGAKYAVAVSSGTAALHLSAMAAGVGPGSTLITSPITFVASANAGLYVGAEVAFADVDPLTINMRPAALEEVLKKKPYTKAIVPVHFAGLPCDMEAIKKLADTTGAVVIEDAAHALGAIYPGGSRVGCCENSLMTCFSFHPVKAIAAGEGGMITTNDEQVYRRLLRIRSHGIQKLDDTFMISAQAETDGTTNPWYYEMQELGFHYRITDIQCALALSQLSKLEKFIGRRRELAKAYDRKFESSAFIRVTQPKGRDSSGHHLYVLNIDFKAAGMSRAKLMLDLKMQGIGTQVHYMPIPMHPIYVSAGHTMGGLPVAAAYYEQALSIPLFYALTDHDQSFVVSAIKETLYKSKEPTQLRA